MTVDDKMGCGLAAGFWTAVLVAVIAWAYLHRNDQPDPSPPVVEEPDASHGWGDLPFIPGAM